MSSHTVAADAFRLLTEGNSLGDTATALGLSWRALDLMASPLDLATYPGTRLKDLSTADLERTTEKLRRNVRFEQGHRFETVGGTRG